MQRYLAGGSLTHNTIIEIGSKSYVLIIFSTWLGQGREDFSLQGQNKLTLVATSLKRFNANINKWRLKVGDKREFKMNGTMEDYRIA